MVEPFIIDYYNSYPNIIDIIDKMNEEAIYLKNENNKLKEEIYNISNKYSRELEEFKQLTDLKYLLLELAKEKKKKKYGCF